MKYLESGQDIIDRVMEIEQSLNWNDDPPSGVYDLYSSRSQRMVCSINTVTGGRFQISTVEYDQLRKGDVFRTLEGAKRWAVFSAIREILSDDLRKATLQ